jgi:formate dehydrogenase iron-sulfur subunit
MNTTTSGTSRGSKATLIDTTKCIGCRSCQVSCKEWNGLPAELTQLNVTTGNLQNPTTLSAHTRCLIQPNEIADEKAPGGLRWVFAKRQCMHCEEPACVSACPTTAMHKQDGDGKVVWDGDKCIGCRYCQWACPWGVPMAEWDSLSPKIDKCTMCNDRAGDPACVKHCPAGALKYGDRAALLREAKERIAKHPLKYVDHIYGEHEAGGTSMLYLSPVPFEKLGFPAIGKEPIPASARSRWARSRPRWWRSAPRSAACTPCSCARPKWSARRRRRSSAGSRRSGPPTRRPTATPTTTSTSSSRWRRSSSRRCR